MFRSFLAIPQQPRSSDESKFNLNPNGFDFFVPPAVVFAIVAAAGGVARASRVSRTAWYRQSSETKPTLFLVVVGGWCGTQRRAGLVE